MSAITTAQIPKIKIHGNTMTTTSLNIAEVFERNHRDVTRKIENLDIPQEFNERNFTRVDYQDAKGEVRKAYDITRDGFTLLAMGFTGKKAMEFKLGYIEAFNTMETELLKKYEQPALPSTITPKQKLSIRDAMNKKVHDNYGQKMIRVGFKKEWHDFYEAFEISKYEELPTDKFDDAMGYILGEWIPEQPKLAIPDDMMLVNRMNFNALKNRVSLMTERYRKIIEVENNMFLAEQAATKAYISMMDFRVSTSDPMREACMLSNSLGNQ